MNYTEDLQSLADADNLRTLPGPVPEGMINLSSNDYLGLSQRGDLWQAFADGQPLDASMMSACSSRLLTGDHRHYAALEQTLCRLFGREAALVYPSGYHTNIGILPALTDSRDVIFADKLVHASIIDGLRLSQATMIRFAHNDCDHLERLLQRHRHLYANAFIVTESIFSMDGDIADLRRLADLKRRFDAYLYVDEAHAFGVRGERGLGIAEEQGAIADIDLLVATFGKAVASMGAFVSCSDLLRRYLVNHSRSMIFTTGLPPVCVAWTRFVVERLPGLTAERRRLRAVSEALARKAGTQCISHIVPLLTGTNASAVEAAARLRAQGFYVLPIRYPTVPQGKARLRFSLTAAIAEADIERMDFAGIGRPEAVDISD